MKKAGVVEDATKIRRFVAQVKQVQAGYAEVSKSLLLQTCNPEHHTYAHMRDVEIVVIENPTNSLAKARQDVRLNANVLLAVA